MPTTRVNGFIVDDVTGALVVSGATGGGIGLTDAELRATAVPVSGPQTDAQARATPQAVSGTVAATGTGDTRFAGGKLAYTGLLNTAGANAVVTPGAAQLVRLVWVSIIPGQDNTGGNLVGVLLGGARKYLAEALAHWEVFDGAVGASLIFELSNIQPVAVTAHYQIITP